MKEGAMTSSFEAGESEGKRKAEATSSESSKVVIMGGDA